jgi:hypothetical protein
MSDLMNMCGPYGLYHVVGEEGWGGSQHKAHVLYKEVHCGESCSITVVSKKL